MGKPIQLGELQLAIMRLLWERREAAAPGTRVTDRTLEYSRVRTV
jgi:hypothetical protein